MGVPTGRPPDDPPVGTDIPEPGLRSPELHAAQLPCRLLFLLIFILLILLSPTTQRHLPELVLRGAGGRAWRRVGQCPTAPRGSGSPPTPQQHSPVVTKGLLGAPAATHSPTGLCCCCRWSWGERVRAPALPHSPAAPWGTLVGCRGLMAKWGWWCGARGDGQTEPRVQHRAGDGWDRDGAVGTCTPGAHLVYVDGVQAHLSRGHLSQHG